MAKSENTKMTVSLDVESKRIIRNLTKAIDRLSRNMTPFKVEDGVTRLMEPAEDPALSDDNENHSPGGGRVELDANATNELRAAVAKYSALG